MKDIFVKKPFGIISVSGLIAISILLFGIRANRSHVDLEELSALEVATENMKFGFNLNDFIITKNTIQPNQFLADILLKHKVSYPEIAEIAENSKEVWDVRYLRAGKDYMVLSSDTAQRADYFIYEPNAFRYVVYSLKDGKVSVVERDIDRIEKTAAGEIESNLWQTMIDQDLDYELAAKMEDALAWSISFHHLQKKDKFKAVYEELYVDGKRVGVGDLKAAYFQNANNEYYAVKFENDQYDGFYNLDGRPMKKAFLRAPVRYTRISSKFNRSRFHPVLKRVRPHLGTDYAAPYGTPIYAVANGVVTQRGYTKGNGNYVKIKHDKTYTTQYLHMQRFKKDVKKGSQVKQGEVIGYVGSTGLATGPHVCFRFWKNGKQVNHLRENLPEPDPMPESDLPAFFQVRDSFKLMLDGIELKKLASNSSDSDVEENTAP